MSQMSAGSKTDVGAYHRDHTEATEKNLGDLAGQFSLQDHRWGVQPRGLAGRGNNAYPLTGSEWSIDQTRLSVPSPYGVSCTINAPPHSL